MLISTDKCLTGPHKTTSAGVSIGWDHTLDTLETRRALFTFINLDTGEQTKIEMPSFVNHCFSLVAGRYRVAVIAPGCEPHRGLVELTPGEVVPFHPTLNPRVDTQVTLKDVLTQLEVPHVDVSVRDLNVPAGTTVVLDSDHQAYAKDWQMITIRDVSSAKRIIGISDEIWGVNAPRFGVASQEEISDPATFAAFATREYVYGSSRSVERWTEHINREIFSEPWQFPIFILGTVTINAGAVLVVGKKSNFFVCGLLRMHVTATLKITGQGPGVIHPLAYESFC